MSRYGDCAYDKRTFYWRVAISVIEVMVSRYDAIVDIMKWSGDVQTCGAENGGWCKGAAGYFRGRQAGGCVHHSDRLNKRKLPVSGKREK
jgi:hypothetical protein